YATNCPNFNLDAIVCEPSYEIKDFGLGHEQASPYKIIHPTPKKAYKKRWARPIFISLHYMEVMQLGVPV
ncbi:MAG: hypothetical protein KHZ78_07475, partial [Peptoniphilus sp. oral taxon 375]|nr:hypothetical protein [Peptoniphilus sp. oral taxon 375]